MKILKKFNWKVLALDPAMSRPCGDEEAYPEKCTGPGSTPSQSPWDELEDDAHRADKGDWQEQKQSWMGRLREAITPESVETFKAKVQRRAPGQGAEVGLSGADLNIALTHGRYALVSSGRNPNNPADMALSDEEIAARHQQLRGQLQTSGYMYTPAVGKYEGSVEDSYLVMAHEAETPDVIELGKMFNQDSVIVADGGRQQMIYTTGENAGMAIEGEGFSDLPDDAPDDYTYVQTADGPAKFTLNFNWDAPLRRVAARLVAHFLNWRNN